MQRAGLDQFENQKYMSLESYRKDGRAVATPVWFAEEGGVFYIYSLADVGKVKRIRNNPRVRIAPCDVRGKLKGSWINAEAHILDASGEEYGHKLLNQKYGMLKRIGDFFSKLRKRKRVVIAIRPAESQAQNIT
jgi:PPOX class probable F420-dependent enzyme